ncbi:Putative amidoligase enzyme [Franzmannia pantelleriensis]|uniref:Putative amidoligase enzyme n=1 Tax=Franzmannia pantelleriensis TaxID=48727 RepID=A0A1G9G3J1_9GAMM|nr:amidoligase family protein [Halomonas pantelleriensis]SDK95167.1 Putative amidoligase enzyme [Halomonas pantelleriensis]
MDVRPPPTPKNAEGKTRRVGVEIEFAGITPANAAQLVCELFGGQVVVVSPHRLKVEGTRWGEFGIELDAKVAHPDAKVVERTPLSDAEWDRQRHQMRVELHNKTRELIGDVVAGLVPTEIVCPPVPWDQLGELDALFDALRVHGAKGTDASLLYGFGLHLNPEAPDLGVDSILAHLRAYLLLAEWLRDQIDIDITREVLPHANPFPKAYAILVLNPDYAPDLDTLIGDYLKHNPTRNRELDLFPLFAELRPDYPDPLFSEALIKPRPTYHYRLPNAQLSAPQWGSVVEWNLWVEVETLAAARERLEARSREYLEHHTLSPMTRWLDKLRSWMNES